MAYELPPLPFDYDALEPHLDAQTIEIHHDKHHAAYVAKLNAALEGHDELSNQPIEELLTKIDSLPESIRTAVRNNGGGHANHALYWSVLSGSGGAEPTGDLATAIEAQCGGFDALKEKLIAAAMGRFGSGWAWLSVDSDRKLVVEDTPNQNTPLLLGNTPLLCIDVWEHAYYLKYQNRRPDYIEALFNLLDWTAIAERFAKAIED